MATQNSINTGMPIPVANGGTGQTTTTSAFDALAPTTTKGDVIVHNGADNIRLPIGADGQRLVADSAQASGLNWVAGTAGTVTSVSGTANRVTSTGGNTPVLDIDAAYVGQASITTVGTLATGTWNAATIAINKGGTGQVTANAAFNALSPNTSKGDITAYDVASNVRIPVGANGTVLSADSSQAGGVAWIASGGAGTVTNVSGTANRVTVATGTTTPVIDISASYIGQTSITTLGTVATGVWSGTSVLVSKGGTGLSTMTTPYSVVCAGTTATGNLQPLAALGASGTVLTSNGASALPSFQAVSSGSYVLLSTTTAASSASVSVTGLTNVYSRYEIVFNGFSTSANAALIANCSTNGGTSYDTSALYSSQYLYAAAASVGAASTTSQTSLLLMGSTQPATSFTSGVIVVYNPNSALAYKQVTSHISCLVSPTIINIATAGYNNVAPVNAIQLSCTSGTIATGVFKLYGVI